jgi:hypothetical protein
VLGAKNFASLIGGSQTLANIMLIAIVVAFALGCIVAATLRRTAPAIYARIGRQDMVAAATEVGGPPSDV